jgi:hypothetical protein
MVCSCGWKSNLYSDGTLFAGFAGELQCPECASLKINKGLESYGHVKVVSILPIKGWSGYADFKPLMRIALPVKLRRYHYYFNYFSLCGNHFYTGDDFLPFDLVDSKIPNSHLQMGNRDLLKCKICEKKFKRLK